MSTSKISSRTTSNKSSRTISSKASCIKGTKSAQSRKLSLSDAAPNITIRLSDLGIKERSPTELDLRIQDERVSYILDATINKLQLAVCLPRLLRHDACLLRRFLEPQLVDFTVDICNKYLSTDTNSIQKWSLALMLSSIDKISMHDSKKKYYKPVQTKNSFVDPHMAQVMQILWDNVPLREMVKAEFPLISQNPCTILVDSFNTLKEIALLKLGVSATEERLREKRLRKSWKAHAVIEENIRKTQELLDKQRQDLGNQLEAKKKLILNFQNKLETFKNKQREDMKHTTMDLEKEMGEDTHFSELRQAEISVEAKSVTQQYEGLLSQHMGIEKGLRAKRFKIETQLCSWLSKFDADIGERQSEFEDVTEGYEAERAIMEGIQEKINEQDAEYQILLKQKEEEEQQMWEDRAYEFLKNRSARKIQRCWRAYRQRKIDKKKAKKAKALAKKLKAEEKAARKEAGEEEPKAPKDKKGGKGKGKGKGKKEQLPPSDGRGPDFQAALEDKFGDELMGDLGGEEFSKKEVVVDLEEDLDD